MAAQVYKFETCVFKELQVDIWHDTIFSSEFDILNLTLAFFFAILFGERCLGKAIIKTELQYVTGFLSITMHERFLQCKQAELGVLDT
jgi:hypothetical protein